MKKLVELLLCFLHPLAVVLIWIDLLSRTDISGGAKLAWAIFALIPLVVFTSRRDIMGDLVNAKATVVVASAVAALITGLNVFLLAQTFGA